MQAQTRTATDTHSIISEEVLLHVRVLHTVQERDTNNATLLYCHVNKAPRKHAPSWTVVRCQC